jgi:hypothetical protein
LVKAEQAPVPDGLVVDALARCLVSRCSRVAWLSRTLHEIAPCLCRRSEQFMLRRIRSSLLVAMQQPRTQS